MFHNILEKLKTGRCFRVFLLGSFQIGNFRQSFLAGGDFSPGLITFHGYLAWAPGKTGDLIERISFFHHGLDKSKLRLIHFK